MRDAARIVVALSLTIALTACGSAAQTGSDRDDKPSATPIDAELPCRKLPPEASCPGPAPARPVPMSPDGPVRSFKSEYLDTEVMISANGVYGVAATAPGTFAVTGTVADGRPDRPPYDPPIEGATVTFSSLSGPGLPAPPGGDVTVTTKTSYDGAFAVIDVPAGRSGSCYRMTVVAPGVGRYESVDVISPVVYEQSIELDGGVEKDPFPYPTRGKDMPPLDRACARAAEASR